MAGPRKVPIKTELVSSLLSSDKRIDGVTLVDFISTYSNAILVADRTISSNIVNTRNSERQKFINPIEYTIPFEAWSKLVKFAIDNYTTSEGAWIMSMLNIRGLFKESLLMVDKGPLNPLNYPYEFTLSPNMASVFTTGLHDYKIINGNNNISVDLGVLFAGKTIVLGIKDIDFVTTITESIVLDSDGKGTFVVDLTGFSSGYVYLDSGVLWSKASYPSILVSNVNAAQLVGLHDYNYIGTSAIIDSKRTAINSARDLVFGVVE